jgi:hypothetical protein
MGSNPKPPAAFHWSPWKVDLQYAFSALSPITKPNHILSLRFLHRPTAVPPSFWVVLCSAIGQANTERLKKCPSIACPIVCLLIFYCLFLLLKPFYFNSCHSNSYNTCFKNLKLPPPKKVQTSFLAALRG